MTPRNFTKEQLIVGLKSGRILVMDRKDAPELGDLIELEREGLVEGIYKRIDDQSTVIEWKWLGK